MKKRALTKVFYGVILSLLMILPVTSYAIDLFDTSTGYLVIPEVDVNGNAFYDDVTLKLDFATGKFEVVSATPKPGSISTTPLDTMEDQDIKMEFMGCARSGRNEVICHLKLTSLGGFDKKVRAYVSYLEVTKLFDDLGNSYVASELTIGDFLNDTGSIDVNLIDGVAILAKYKFSNISSHANSLSLFQPAFDGNDSNTPNIIGDFRNIDF